MFLELKLLKIRSREEKKLNKKNYNSFKEIEEYMKNSTLSSIEREEVFQQILDMMLQAQSENKSINLFLGSNHKKFCDSIINEYNSSKSFIFKTIDFIEEFIVYFLIWISLDMLFSFSLQFNINSLITVSLLCIITFIKKSKITSTNQGNIKSTIKSFSFIVPLVLIIKIIINTITSIFNINTDININLYSVRYFIVGFILFLLISQLYKIKSNKIKILQ
ncbi:DNA-binding ferritin-like protein (Dps family) [Clostridium tetanomorphum]|uniref:DUF1048 domain-containing protein n=1 Tax=Clostridium tetanomorphum TaxID=1553 RepID=A0A923EAM3_CLOTT|nr:DUF1048 domain-containing protein [Clostridium tetanomorphum]KAJ52942.1 hypothetical protein CTM_04793 [Clostridium tetanomorphum DSM 665]MBC2398196.1 DUF1048 domain-containing protein [Clostridium tetanomorphum]MBP1864882.1 DNA-binding ferritin-like protein (Dps family) [Clostridium tetanomorphum]NRS83088.1 DNA-binding ferritin-like protein (Dps family) [Clostridium tetanomorphum]NRZ98815.1 DNA-binding ferritin-like protein (Dps family) [Clostridium tetanomorphum]